MKHSIIQTVFRALCGLVLLAGITEKVQAINSYYWVSRDWTSGAVYGAYWSYNNSWSTSSGGSGLGSSISPQSYLYFDGSAAAPANGLYNNTNDFNNAAGFQLYFKNTVPAAYNLYGNPISFYDISGTDPNIQNEGTTYTPTINFAVTNANNNGTFRILNINLNSSPAQGPLTFNGPVYGGASDANSRVINIGGGNITFNNLIANGAGGGALALTLLGSGTVTLAATNTFTGDLSINAGTVVLATNNALASGGNFIRLGNATGSTGANLNLNGGNVIATSINVRSGSSGGKIIANTLGTTGSATFAGAVYLDSPVTIYANTNGGNVFNGAVFDLKAQTLTVDGSGSNYISAPLTNSTGSGALVKNGSGILILAGRSTYAGASTLNAGTLLLTGALGTNTLNVNSNAVFNGTGTVNGPTVVNFGGTLQAGLGGADLSTLAISNTLTLAGKTVFNLNRTNTPTANKISGLTTVTYGGTLTVTNVGQTLQASDTFTLFQSGAYAGGFTNLVLPTLSAGLGWNTNNLAVNGSISVVSLIGVTVAPATTNVIYGTSVTLTANVTGTGPFTYQWFDNNTNAIAGQTNSTLTVTPAVAASGNYTVVASNLGDSATNNGAITVNALAVVLSGTRAYDGTTAAAAGILSVANKVGVDDVTVASGSATLAGATVTTQSITSFGSLALGGTTAGNYTFTGASGAVVITAAGTATAVASSSNPIGYLGALTFTANVSPTNAGGNVTFSANGTPFSTNTLVAGVAVSGGISSLARGTNTITAAYGGDANYSGSSGGLSQVVTNHLPVAGNVSYTVAAGVVALQVAVSNLLATVTDADSDSITLVSVGNSTNGITPVIAGSLVQYYNTNGVSDQFSYTVTDGFGGTNTAYVSIVVSNAIVGQVTGAFTSFTGGVANLTFLGIPNLNYVAERSTNLADWVDVVTNTAATNGVINISDYFYDLSGTPPASAYYRLKWQP